MGLQTELGKLRSLIESAKEKPRQRAEEEIARQKGDFNASRNQEVQRLEELQKKIMAFAAASVPILAIIGVAVGAIIVVVDYIGTIFASTENGGFTEGAIVMILVAPILLPIAVVVVAIVGGVAGLLIGGLLYGVGEIACEVLTSSIESLKKQTWEPPQSNPKDLLPP